jgi:hypothetical protein
MGLFLDVTDLPADVGSSLKLTPEQMIDDAEALAVLAAPCLGDEPSTLTAGQLAAVKAILRGAIMRWNDAATGVIQYQTAGSYSVSTDTKQPRRGMFWPSEIEQLQNICGPSATPRKAFMIDQVQPTTTGDLADRPDLWFQWVFPASGNS